MWRAKHGVEILVEKPIHLAQLLAFRLMGCPMCISPEEAELQKKQQEKGEKKRSRYNRIRQIHPKETVLWKL
jgi:hypothetical protein